MYVEEKRGLKQRGSMNIPTSTSRGNTSFNMVMLQIPDALYMFMHKRRRSCVMYIGIACYKAVLMNQFVVWILNSML